MQVLENQKFSGVPLPPTWLTSLIAVWSRPSRPLQILQILVGLVRSSAGALRTLGSANRRRLDLSVVARKTQCGLWPGAEVWLFDIPEASTIMGRNPIKILRCAKVETHPKVVQKKIPSAVSEPRQGEGPVVSGVQYKSLHTQHSVWRFHDYFLARTACISDFCSTLTGSGNSNRSERSI
ncbi:hypothetical protein VTO42DRAFT_6314 [Malbranchea cinnamomea]